MKEQNKLKLKGKVIDIYSNGTYCVQLDNNNKIIAHAAGKIRLCKVRIVLGDIVEVELSPYDLTRGRIVYRIN